MRHLAMAAEPSRLTPIQTWAYEWRGARALAPGLWQLRSGDDGSSLDGNVLRPLARGVSLEGLLAAAAETRDVPPQWSLRYTSYVHDGRRAAPIRAGRRRPAQDTALDILCVAARALPGRPSLDPSPRLLLVRTPRLWYLTLALDGAGAVDRAAALDTWRVRPYSFSAATDLILARLAVSLAAAHHVRSGKSLRGSALLDPCCGSGTFLYAARLAGLDAVGLDLNPKAVQGTRANMRHVETAECARLLNRAGLLDPNKVLGDVASIASAPTTVLELELPEAGSRAASSRVLLHDCTRGPPPAEATGSVGLIVASLPFGRQQRIPHAGYLHALLAPLAAAMPDATFCLLSGSPLVDVASLAELVLHRSDI